MMSVCGFIAFKLLYQLQMCLLDNFNVAICLQVKQCLFSNFKYMMKFRELDISLKLVVCINAYICIEAHV